VRLYFLLAGGWEWEGEKKKASTLDIKKIEINSLASLENFSIFIFQKGIGHLKLNAFQLEHDVFCGKVSFGKEVIFLQKDNVPISVAVSTSHICVSLAYP